MFLRLEVTCVDVPDVENVQTNSQINTNVAPKYLPNYSYGPYFRSKLKLWHINYLNVHHSLNS